MQIVTLAERPDLADAPFPGVWPEFLYHDAVSGTLYGDLIAAHPSYSLVALDGPAPVAMACTFPFTGSLDALPDGGYDAIILQAAADRVAGRQGNLVGAVEIAVQVHQRGRRLSGWMLGAVLGNARRLGHTDVVVALRPNHKPRFPELSLDAYIRRVRPDGLPEDPCLRTHIRAGGRVLGLAPTSMVVTAPLPQWREWTGLPFTENGPVLVPEALVPVQVDQSAGRAVYIEPNVWVHHRVR
jgi:hypothetical protein